MKKETKCIRSCRSGRFKVSLLEQTRTYQQRKDRRDFSPEKSQTNCFIAIQHGKKVDGKWENQTIFCSTHDFHNLQDAIDDLTYLKEEGDEKSPKSTPTKGGDEE